MTTEERLELLEQELVRAKRRHRSSVTMVVLVGVIIVFAGLSAVGTTNAHSQDEPGIAAEVRAHRFVLLDAAGKPRATLDTQDEGPVLLLLGEHASVAKLSASNDGPVFALSREGQIRAMLRAGESGPSLVLADEAGQHRVGLSAGKDGPMLTLLDKAGKPCASLIASQIGSALTLFDEMGKLRLALATEKDGPSLDLLDENEMTRAVLGVTQTETSDGKDVSYPESSLLLFSPDGKVRWSTP